MKKRRFLTIGTGIATTALFFSQTLLAGASYLTSNGSVTTTHLTEDVTYQACTIRITIWYWVETYTGRKPPPPWPRT